MTEESMDYTERILAAWADDIDWSAARVGRERQMYLKNHASEIREILQRYQAHHHTSEQAEHLARLLKDSACLCQGSGKPVRENGSCAYCGAGDVRGSWHRTEAGQKQFAVYPRLHYCKAIEHVPSDWKRKSTKIPTA